MEGYQYLNESDTLVVYYSDENSTISRGMVEDLKNEGVNVRMVRLLKQHSNALDMYIASTTGMYLDAGEKILIVSKDKGYAAVRDFWHSLRGVEILLGETIEECLLHSVKNDDARVRLVKERHQRVLLTDVFSTMNTIPTQPTLSRGSRRLFREASFNLKEDKADGILPNPLSASSEDVKENAAEDMMKRSEDPENGVVIDALNVNPSEIVPKDLNTGLSFAGGTGESFGGKEDAAGSVPSESAGNNRNQRNRRRGRGRFDRTSENVVSGKEGVISEKSPVSDFKEEKAAVSEKAENQNSKNNTAEPKRHAGEVRFIYDPLTGTFHQDGESGSEDVNVEKSEKELMPENSVETASSQDEKKEESKANGGRRKTSSRRRRKSVKTAPASVNAEEGMKAEPGSEEKALEKPKEKTGETAKKSEKENSKGTRNKPKAIDKAGSQEKKQENRGKGKTSSGGHSGQSTAAPKETRKKAAALENPDRKTSSAKDSGRKSLSEKKSVPLPPDFKPEDILEANKNVNTLHQYYIRLMKVYGRSLGGAYYDKTKKMMQAELKKRAAD